MDYIYARNPSYTTVFYAASPTINAAITANDGFFSLRQQPNANLSPSRALLIPPVSLVVALTSSGVSPDDPSAGSRSLTFALPVSARPTLTPKPPSRTPLTDCAPALQRMPLRRLCRPLVLFSCASGLSNTGPKYPAAFRLGIVRGWPEHIKDTTVQVSGDTEQYPTSK
ncbi:hypothetical protein B0H16DRAFT_1738911 [Mycena metata]|uniref:Uncharacterized protein n=1 Tax=Mycena metata TaxID=1033252 RepID=A0AAD7HGH2_9AGAR|nr:hypothetical protein B0H16DRAFT_1738911 [Mycena metata]